MVFSHLHDVVRLNELFNKFKVDSMKNNIDSSK